MKLSEVDFFNIGPRLALTFVLLMALILGGNGLLIWQFQQARVETDRLTSVSQQLVAVLRLRESLLSFHQQLDEIAQSRDARRFATDAEPLRRSLLEESQRTRLVLTHLPAHTSLDPAFVPTLEAIDVTLPSQIRSVLSLAEAGDWEAVRLRLSKELKPLETQTSALVNSIDQEVSQELAPAVANMQYVQRRILLIVPLTAACTFSIAAFFAWAVTRRILELRMEERLNERTRIARELHDTLLQGFISATMQFHVAISQLPADSPARSTVERGLEMTSMVIDEARNAIRGFRAIDTQKDLAQSLSSVPQELELKTGFDFRVIVEGRSRALHALVRDEVYSIGREALVNSFRHSRANRIELELEYSAERLRLLVRDDGCGIHPEILRSASRDHWGLVGMRERTAKIGGKLKVLTRVGGGTEVELCVPAGVAFESR